MAFLNPILLFGLIAAVIPLAIHFLGRRKPRRVAFSAIAFLEQVRRQQFRRLRFRNWVLLLLRTLTIVFLVLAFAKPAIRSLLSGLGYFGESAMVVVLDDGPSMGYASTEGSRFDWAKSRLSDVKSLIGPNDWAVFIRTSVPDLVHPLDDKSISALDDPSPWSGNGAYALTHASELLGRSDAANRELYILSDLAGPPWNATGNNIEWPTRTTVYALVPPSETTTNLAIDSIAGGGELVRSGQPFRVNAFVRNTGESRLVDVPIALWIAGRRVQQRTITVAPNERVAVEFLTMLPNPGWISGRVEIVDDALMMDNVRWFSLDVPPETRITIIGEATQSRASLEAIFTSPDRSSPYRINVRSVADVDRHDIESADVIILNEHANVGDRVAGWLRDAVDRGTGLLVLIGPETDLQYLNRQVISDVSSTRIVGLRSTGLRDSASYFGVEPSSSENAIASGLFGIRGTTSPRIANYAVLRVPDGSTLLSFTSGDPWITLEQTPNGSVAVLAAGLNTSWSDLTYRGAVVPLFHRLVHRLARPVAFSPDYVVGAREQNLTLPLAPTRNVVVERPDGTSQPATISTETGSPTISIGVIDAPGIWNIRSGNQTIATFAANSARAESDLKPLDLDAFRDRYGSPDLHEVRGDVSTYVESSRRGTELDIVFLLLGILCIAFELLLMRGIRTSSHAAIASPLP